MTDATAEAVAIPSVQEGSAVRKRTGEELRATGETIALRMLLVECFTLHATRTRDPGPLFDDLRKRLLGQANKLTWLRDDPNALIAKACAATINNVLMVAEARTVGRRSRLRKVNPHRKRDKD